MSELSFLPPAWSGWSATGDAKMGPGGRVELGTPTSMVDRKAAWICCEMGLRSNKTLLGCFSSRTRSFFPSVWFGWPAAWSTKMGLDGLFVLGVLDLVVAREVARFCCETGCPHPLPSWACHALLFKWSGTVGSPRRWGGVRENWSRWAGCVSVAEPGRVPNEFFGLRRTGLWLPPFSWACHHVSACGPGWFLGCPA